jgi:uncharacterized damage-inducible protein DinB
VLGSALSGGDLVFTKLSHFERAWEFESEGTLKLLRALTDASLSQAIAPQERTLGRIAWHITTSLPEMMARTGVKLAGPAEHAPLPATAAAIVAGYEAASASLVPALKGSWTDQTLQEVDDMYGDKWKRGLTLTVLVTHQTHHRGQMTVLMRQAGLRVPGIYGPAREEWAGMGLEPPAV